MFNFSLTIVARICPAFCAKRTESHSQFQRLVDARQARHAIFLQVHIWKSAIIQVHGQTCIGQPVVTSRERIDPKTISCSGSRNA